MSVFVIPTIEVEGMPMSRFYWCSFYADKALMPAFEYHGPWWISGYAAGADHELDEPIIVAAVMAESEVEAMETLRLAYDEDKRPASLTQRFCEPKGWESPFSDRFPRADWMRWPWPALSPATTPHEGKT